MKRKASLPKLFLDEEELRGFKSAIIGVKGQEDYQKEVIRRKTSLLTGISFNNTKSNGNVLVVNLFSTHWSGELPMLAHNLLDLQNIHVGDSPKVLYIGQSKQIRRRTSAHEKIQRALSEVSDDRDIYVYFFTFVTQEIFMNRPDEMIKLLNDPDAGRIEDEGQLNLVEMALINYFKPKYNTTFVSSAILLNQQVEHLLRANGFTQMALEISFDDPLWCFGSDHISPKQNHIIIHRLSEK
jgi:hypothetical protein